MATIDTIADRSTGSAIAGKAYFETSTNKFIVHNGSAWIEVHSDGTGPAFQNQWGANFTPRYLAPDYLETASDPGLTIKSLSYWFNQPASLNCWAVSGIGGTQYTTHGGFGTNTNGRIKWNDGQSGGTSATNTFSYNTWNHVAFFHVPSGYVDTTGSTTSTGAGWAIYVNNIRVDIQSSNGAFGTTPCNTTDQFKIGTEGQRPWMLTFDGKLDEVALFTSSISASDVSNIYNGGVPVDLGTGGLNLSPAMYYRMGDDSNDSPSAGGNITGITDSSGNGHDLQSTATTQPAFSDLTGETIYV